MPTSKKTANNKNSVKKNPSKKTSKTFYVKGLHCSACEILVKNSIMSMEGIDNVKVSLSGGSVTVTASNNLSFPTLAVLNNTFAENGYYFNDKKEVEKDLVLPDIAKVALLALLFIAAFFYLEKSTYIMSFSLSSDSSPIAYFLFGVAASISSCAALVGGLLLAMSKEWIQLYGTNAKKQYLPFLYFNISRIFTFALLGGLIGYLGSLLSFSVTTTVALTIFVSIIMLIIGLRMLGVKFLNFSLVGSNTLNLYDKTLKLRGRYFPLILGAITFFIPCGFTMIAQTTVLSSGSFVSGTVNLLFFSLGTLPILALISFTGLKVYSKPKFSKIFSLFSGILITFFALYTINSQLNILGYKSLNDVRQLFNTTTSNKSPLPNAPLGNLEYQVLQMEASGIDYYPSRITLRSGVLTKWEIFDSGARGCARAVYGHGLYSEVIRLKPGQNSVEFIAPKPGTYKISCSMGMVTPVIVEVI